MDAPNPVTRWPGDSISARRHHDVVQVHGWLPPCTSSVVAVELDLMTVVIHAAASGLHDLGLEQSHSVRTIAAWDAPRVNHASARDTLQKWTAGHLLAGRGPRRWCARNVCDLDAAARARGGRRALVGSPADSGSARKPLHPVTTQCSATLAEFINDQQKRNTLPGTRVRCRCGTC
jgi:hypothetical protein